LNVVKGIDKIAIVLAIGMAILVFFPLFGKLSQPSDNPEFTVWYAKCKKRVSELENLNPSIKEVGSLSRWDRHEGWREKWIQDDLASARGRRLGIQPITPEQERKWEIEAILSGLSGKEREAFLQERRREYLENKREAEAKFQREAEIRVETRKQRIEDRVSVLDGDNELQKMLDSEPERRLYNPLWKKILLTVLGSLAVSFALFLGICGTARGVKWLFLWIIGGFKS
jgi:hypothetical protein